jgi:hypothetical protein
MKNIIVRDSHKIQFTSGKRNFVLSFLNDIFVEEIVGENGSLLTVN